MVDLGHLIIYYSQIQKYISLPVPGRAIVPVEIILEIEKKIIFFFFNNSLVIYQTVYCDHFRLIAHIRNHYRFL